MARLSGDLFRGFAAQAGDHDAEARSRRANRRRLFVFLAVFSVVAIIGLVWDLARPAIYEATARLNFVQAANQAATPTDAGTPGPQYSLRDEVQYLTSRTLLAKVWDEVKDAKTTPSALHAGDPPATLQTMLTATQVAGTNVVAISAEGSDAAFLPTFVDRLLADYQASLSERFQGGSSTAIGDAQDESQKLESAVSDKRKEVDAYRIKYNIVSLEHDENQVLSDVKGIGEALNLANQKVVAAEGKLAAIKEAGAAGKTVLRARDNPTLAALEAADAQIRADLRATSRQFTQQYMDMDPKVREQRAKLDEIDGQIAQIRKDSASGAVVEAQEEVAAARGAVSQLRQQLAANQGSVQAFTSHLNEYKALQDQLTHLETQRQKALDRVSTLDTGERGRKPKVEVVESPALPQSPVSPLYARDGALVLFAALLAGLATMGIVEFFNRPPPTASTVVVPQTWTTVGMTHDMPTALPRAQRDALPRGVSPNDALTHEPAPPALAAPLPRELATNELAALFTASDNEFRGMLALLLSGLTAGEVVALRRGDVDRVNGTVSIAGDMTRSIVLPPTLLPWLPAETTPADAALFTAHGDRPLPEATVATALLYAAHDANLADADSVTPDALRHTYIVFLVRQGMRFAELARIVGTLPQDRLASYRRLAPAGPHGAPELVLPAVRQATMV